MGCQQAIVREIVQKKADYILSVKNNQQELYQGIEDAFRFERQSERVSASELDFGHGRIENRTCYISSNLEYINSDKWTNINTLVKIVSERYHQSAKKQEQPTIRYYISSLKSDVQRFNSLISSHWAIENKLHWMMDVAMGEDASRKRAINAPQNFSVVFKTALTMLKKYKPEKGKPSVKTKRKMGGWSDEHLIAMIEIDPA